MTLEDIFLIFPRDAYTQLAYDNTNPMYHVERHAEADTPEFSFGIHVDDLVKNLHRTWGVIDYLRPKQLEYRSTCRFTLISDNHNIALHALLVHEEVKFCQKEEIPTNTHAGIGNG